jgi:peptide-methionine (S)-S-oxide reductase
MRSLFTAALLAVAVFAAGTLRAEETVVEVQLGEPEPAAEAVGIAIFAGGCFWCMEPPFDKLDGVLSTTSGYIGGSERNPSYQQVASGQTGHIEAVEIRYDPQRIDYATLLAVFWRNIDPLAVNRQFCDAGPQYRSAIFPRDAEQRRLARESLRALAESGRFDRPIATEILPATIFWPAEDYHQDYYLKNPIRYRYYRASCGRDRRLRELWGE